MPSNETQSNPIADLPVHDDVPGPAKTEAMIVESSEAHTPIIENIPNPLSTRTNTKISREYLTQHITYRAQRLAAKVEPEMVDYFVSILYLFTLIF